MMYFKLFAILGCLILSINIGHSQIKPGLPQEPGKCYAKCIIQDTITTKTILSILPKENQPLYTDERIKQVSKAFYNSYLEDPNNYKINMEEARVVQKGNGRTEWREVVCGDATDRDEIVRHVQLQLQTKGYDITEINNQMTKNTKACLEQFQRDNNLPIGNLDYLTLKSLEVPGYASTKPKNSNSTSTDSLKAIVVTNLEACFHKENFERYTTQDTMKFSSTVYTGTKVSKLEYADYVDLSIVNPLDYNPNNPRHAVVLDSNYEKLYSKSPGDFTERENTVGYERVIRPGGVESFDCLCPDHPEIETIQTKVESSLKVFGYAVDNEFGEISKRSLAQFQLKHNRPIGVLDFETLDLLGVEY